MQVITFVSSSMPKWVIFIVVGKRKVIERWNSKHKERDNERRDR